MDNRRQIRLPVYGLCCGGAGATMIERVLAAADGVLSACVDRGTETASVDNDPAETNERTLARAIERAGYQAGRPTEA